MSRHLSGWCDFGITPKRLMCAAGKSEGAKGPVTWDSLSSESRYSSITSGCSDAE